MNKINPDALDNEGDFMPPEPGVGKSAQKIQREKRRKLAEEIREKTKPEMDYYPEPEESQNSKIDESLNKSTQNEFEEKKEDPNLITEKTPQKEVSKTKTGKQEKASADSENKSDDEDLDNTQFSKRKQKFIDPVKIKPGVILLPKRTPKFVKRPTGDRTYVTVSKETIKELKLLSPMLDMNLKEYTEAALEHYKNYMFDIK